jgi:thiosulfate/3-mercaptopyruvate sulfurtransferase
LHWEEGEFAGMESIAEVSESEGRLLLPGLLVAADWVVQQLDHPALRLLDIRAADAYAEGHLPGAAHLELPEITCVRDGVPGMLIPAADFAARLAQAGIDSDNAVVLYDDNWGMAAARVLWALARYGLTNVAILDGGWDRWQEQGYPQTTTPTAVAPTAVTLAAADHHLAEREWLLTQGDRADLVIVDTRTPKEYSDGHLPNAVNWDWMNAVPMGAWEMMRAADELRQELAALGVTPDKEIVTYCRSGVRAAHTYVVLRALGFPRVRNYDGSWLEWSHYLPANAKEKSHE